MPQPTAMHDWRSDSEQRASTLDLSRLAVIQARLRQLAEDAEKLRDDLAALVPESHAGLTSRFSKPGDEDAA